MLALACLSMISLLGPMSAGAQAQYTGWAPDGLRWAVNSALQGEVAYMQPRIDDHLRSLPSTGNRCAADYEALFAKPVIDVRIAIGYLDWVDLAPRPGMSEKERTEYFYRATAPGALAPQNISFGYNASSDLFLRWLTQFMLTRPCAGTGSEVCGFQADPSYAVFEKTAVGSGGRSVIVRVRLANGSATPFYAYNLGEGKNLQDEASRECEDDFFGGLREADVVLYHGHARAGGGPDCQPVRTRTGLPGGLPDYSGYYWPQKPGFTRMLESLRARRAAGAGSPYFIGLFACESNPLFLKSVQEAAPEARLAVSTLVQDKSNEVASGPIEALDAILKRQCHNEFVRSISLPLAQAPNSALPGAPFQLVEPLRKTP